jgi:hypothetical protein
MATLTTAQLTNNLCSMDKTVLATVRTVTVPEMRKTNNPFCGKVVKVQDLSASVGSWNYQRAVNNRRQKEWQKALLSDETTPQPAEFVSEARKWGTRVPNTPFVEHKGQLYVELSVHKCLRQVYLDDQGNPVSKELLEPYLPKKKEGERQELDNPIILRDVKVENIVSVTYGGQTAEVQEQATLAPSKLVI